MDFVPFSGALGAWPRFAPMDPPLKVMSPPPVDTYMCKPTIDVGRIFRDGYIRLGAPSFSALGAPWSPKTAPVASDIGPSPLQGAPAGDLVLLSPLTLRKRSVACRRPNMLLRKIRYGDPA